MNRDRTWCMGERCERKETCERWVVNAGPNLGTVSMIAYCREKDRPLYIKKETE